MLGRGRVLGEGGEGGKRKKEEMLLWWEETTLGKVAARLAKLDVSVWKISQIGLQGASAEQANQYATGPWKEQK